MFSGCADRRLVEDLKRKIMLLYHSPILFLWHLIRRDYSFMHILEKKFAGIRMEDY